jgi:hypothetical protein
MKPNQHCLMRFFALLIALLLASLAAPMNFR